MNVDPILFKLLGMLLLGGGMALAAGVAFLDSHSIPRELWIRYTTQLDREFRALFMQHKASDVARLQLIVIASMLLATFFLSQPLFILVAIIAGLAPRVIIDKERVQKTNLIEEQLAHWLTLLANALRASPSIPAAVEATVKLVPPPIQDHVGLVVKEVRLGQPIEQALRNMGKRIDSQTVQNALSTIMIGQRTGGNVPSLLEESAAGLREMARLESLIRAKTAEGKGQVLVLALMPLGLIFLLQNMADGWFDPFFENGPKGYFLIGVAAAVWGAAIFISNRILDIEV